MNFKEDNQNTKGENVTYLKKIKDEKKFSIYCLCAYVYMCSWYSITV